MRAIMAATQSSYSSFYMYKRVYDYRGAGNNVFNERDYIRERLQSYLSMELESRNFTVL